MSALPIGIHHNITILLVYLPMFFVLINVFKASFYSTALAEGLLV
jgi:hypothetical protein